MSKIRVLLVDDQVLFMEGLANLLATRGINVVGTARDGFDALEKARTLRPDVVLMDVRMPRCDGLQATRLLRAELPDVKIVMLTVSEDDDDLFAAIKSGASGYLLKNLDGGALFSLLSSLASGEAPLAPGMAARLLREFARTPGQERPGVAEGLDITPRQVAILGLVARGVTYRQIGSELCLSERTVKYHIAQIIERLHVKSRAEAIALARHSGLVRDAGSRKEEEED